MPQLRYEEIADRLRARISAGQEGYRPGDRLPGIGRLAQAEQASIVSVREAIYLLEIDGLVVVRDKEGTFVIGPDDYRNHIDLGTSAKRNSLGYVFAKPMGHWPPVGTPSRDWVACPEDVADLLGIAAGSPVLARHRVVGPGGRPMQVTTTYLVEDLARGTVLEQADTGPGGWIDRVEQDMGHGPLTWQTEITARLPTRGEVDALGISPRLPVLVTYRTHTTPTGRVIAVDVVVVDGKRMSVRVPISRDESAQWPTTPATARNSPPSVGDTPEEVPDDQRHPGQGG